eukprot:353939-Chlamydomonas_euryale.AAC.16
MRTGGQSPARACPCVRAPAHLIVAWNVSNLALVNPSLIEDVLPEECVAVVILAEHLPRELLKLLRPAKRASAAACTRVAALCAIILAGVGLGVPPPHHSSHQLAVAAAAVAIRLGRSRQERLPQAFLLCVVRLRGARVSPAAAAAALLIRRRDLGAVLQRLPCEHVLQVELLLLRRRRRCCRGRLVASHASSIAVAVTAVVIVAALEKMHVGLVDHGVLAPDAQQRVEDGLFGLFRDLAQVLQCDVGGVRNWGRRCGRRAA